MKSLMQHKSLFTKIVCCVLAFSMTFYSVCTPALAAELAGDDTEVMAVEPETSTATENASGVEEPLAPASEEPGEDESADESVADETEGSDEGLAVAADTNITVAEDPEETEEPVEVEPRHVVDVASSFDPDEREITYTVTVSNPSDTAINGLSFTMTSGEDTASTYSGLIGYEETGEDEYVGFTIDSPTGPFDLAAGQSRQFVMRHTLMLEPAAGEGVTVTFSAAVAVEGEAAVIGSDIIACFPPYEAYDVTSYVSVIDENGSKVSADEPLFPGDIVYFNYTVTNTGTVALHNVSAALKIGDVLVGEDWGVARDLAPGESRTFIGSHCVIEEEALLDSPDIYNCFETTVDITVGDITKSYDLVSSKVAKEYYGYCIDFASRPLQGNGLYYPTLKLNLRQIDSELYLPVDYILENCPEGYEPTLYHVLPNGGYDLIDLQNDEPIIMTPGVESYFIVIYQEIPNEADYVVNYYVDAVADENLIDSVYGTGNVGATIPVDFAYCAPVGYKADGIAEGATTISADAAQNVVNVVYAPDSFKYYAHAYSQDVNGIVTDLGLVYGGKADFGSTVTVPGNVLNTLCPVGFAEVTEGEDYSLTIGADEAANVVDVMYTPATFTYAIKYYRDNSIDDSYHIQGEDLVGEALYGSTVHVDEGMLNRNLPTEGFYSKTEADGFDFVITADAGENTQKVVYERMQVGYTLVYYKDSSESEDNLLGTVDGSYLWDYEHDLTAQERNLFLPEGYKRIFNTMYVHISSDPAKNVLKIVYDKKRDDLGYTVNYYQDSVEGKLLGSDTGTGTFGDEIPYENGKYAPAGYSAEGAVSGATSIGVDEGANVLNVVYSKGMVGYTVNYYKDSVEGELLESVSGEALLGSDIPYEADRYVPVGYDIDNVSTDGQLVVTANAQENILNVIYSKQKNLAWRIDYYMGAMEGAPVASDSGYGVFEDEIPYVEGAHLSPGYTTPAQISGNTSIVNADGVSVMNVVYPRAAFAYTINYYKDFIDDANRLGTDSLVGLYGSAINLEYGKNAPEGYRKSGETQGILTVGYDAASNVLNVIYHRDSFGFTVNYYKGSVASANLIESVHDADDLREYGSTVELRLAEINARRPDGFAAVANTRMMTIGADASRNVIDIVFDPDFGEFYGAGIEPVVTTYDGRVHTIVPGGVKDNDVVTYSYNGLTQTRTVGVDSNIGVDFVDVTNGDVPVTVMITRAGISSQTLETLVNIAPAPVTVPDSPQVTPAPAVPGDSGAPTTPGTPAVPGDVPAEGSQAADPGVPGVDLPTFNADSGESVISQIARGIISYIDSGLSVPQADALSLDGESIDDDANPLASSPYGQTKSYPLVSYLLVVLATTSLVAMALIMLLVQRKASLMPFLDSDAAIMNQSRMRVMKRVALVLLVCSLAMYAGWLLLIL